MLKFFFNRFSKVVSLMEILGVAFTLGWLLELQKTPPSPMTRILLGIYILQYLFLCLCRSKRWYKNAKRYEGIELQFKKAMIPASYMMALTSGVGYFTGSTLLLWPVILLMGVILHVNAILLYLHYKDKNLTPVNYYSNNKTLTNAYEITSVITHHVNLKT